MKIKNFIKKWSGHGYEKGETHSFWLSLLREVFNVDEPEKIIRFEIPVPQGFIDALIDDTNTLIEQKSSTVNLDDEEIFLQAKRYNDALEYSRKARRIVTCNFKEFRVYDMDKRKPQEEPLIIALEELPEKFHALEFLVDRNKIKLRVELELSLQAGEIVAKIYDALLTQYLNPNSPESLASLNKLCVRLVFCLYAESSGIFGKHKIFRDYLERENNIRRGLLDLFEVLNTPLEKRDPYLDDTLKKFPYVNGGLFEGSIEIPNFTPEIKELLLEEASSGFNWSGISPTIFGAVFESTLNPETRRAGGMHYTSIENIHKVIDPLFLNDLKAEAKNVIFDTFHFTRSKRKNFLLQLQKKLSEIKIFDPACGSGNFLTASFISLRRIENEILKLLFGSQIQLGELVNPIKVSISQFYGVEINDFAVAVAQTALWIAELQMMIETQEIIHRDLDFLPLKSYSNIIKANALQIDWKNVCPNPNFIIGNPPFVGRSFRLNEQKNDLQKIFSGVKGSGNLDYVACWYKKAADFIDNKTFCAFVSTNSICQGISVPPLWKYLFDKGIVINFAHQTFKWTSESSDIAAVHCVVVGFSKFNSPVKKIFDGKNCREVKFINAYLIDGANIIVEPQKNPIQKDIPLMFNGSEPVDGGNLILLPAERDELIKKNPLAKKYIRLFVGGDEFINGKVRYCLWLIDCPPNELRKMSRVMKRVEGVRDFRLASKKDLTRHRAETPTQFQKIRQPTTDYILIPQVSSDRRRYIPMGFMSSNIIASNLVFVIPNAELYHFGVLTSSIHMAWMRISGGRFGTGYRYGVQTVYNTFIWCEATEKQKRLIEATAQRILDVRKKYPDATLADLYDELSMPKDLRAAHRANDKAVAAAYGFEKILDDERAIVGELMKLYAALTKK